MFKILKLLPIKNTPYEEWRLLEFVGEGKGFDEISSITGKSRLSVKGKLFNSGLNSVVVATHAQRAVATTIATTTSPIKGNTDSLVFLKDATVVQNAVAAASSPDLDDDLAPVSALSSADVVAIGLKTKPVKLGLSLKDNTQL